MGLDYLFIYEDEKDIGLLVGYLRKRYFDDIFVCKNQIQVSNIQFLLRPKKGICENVRGIRVDGIFTSFDANEINIEQRNTLLYPLLKTDSIFINNDLYYINDISDEIGKEKAQMTYTMLNTTLFLGGTLLGTCV
jgi:hypothetical protein